MLESRKECTRSSMKNRLWREVGSRGTKVEFWRVIQGRRRGPDIGWQWGRSEVTDLSDPLSFQVSFVIKVQFLNVCVWWGGHVHMTIHTHRGTCMCLEKLFTRFGNLCYSTPNSLAPRCILKPRV